MILLVTETKKQRPTICICVICSKTMPVAVKGPVRLTCSDRCRQIKKRYKGWHQWRDAVYYRVKERRIDKLLRQVERKIGSMDFPFNPAHPDLTMGEMVKRTFMRSLNGRVEDLTYCGNCGRPYVPKGNRWKYWHMCSDRCARSYAQNVKRESASFYANPRPVPEEVTDRMRKRKRLTLCAHCDGAFVPKGRRKYCSDKCKDAAYWKRRPLHRCKGCGERYRGHRMVCSDRCYYQVVQHCGRCRKVVQAGAEILPNADTSMPNRYATPYKARPIVFCSEQCRDAVGWSPVQKACIECGEAYYPRKKVVQRRQRFCSKRCNLRHHNRLNWQKRKIEKARRLCRHCGEPLPDDRPHRHYRYCSEGCRIEASEMRRSKSIPIPSGMLLREYQESIPVIAA